MNFNKFQRTIILLLLSLVVSHCDCNKDKSENNRQSTRKKGGNPELTEEQKKQKQEEQKKQKEEQERQRQEEFIRTVKEEKPLENKAKQTLGQLKQMEGPTKPIFTSMDATLDEDIERAKSDPEEASKMVSEVQEMKKDVETLKIELETAYKQRRDPKLDLADSMHPSIQELLALIGLIPDNSELKKALNEERAIDFSKLTESEKLFYNRIVTKYALASQHAGIFLHSALLEETQNLLKATNARLAIFQNIQKQHQLKKG